MKSWILLFIAACFEVCWIFSIKYIDKSKLATLRLRTLFSEADNFWIIAPVLGYVVFGIANIVLFSASMKDIQASTAFAVWMALALIFTKIVEVIFFGEAFTLYHLLFTSCIVVGILGLKWLN